MNLYTAMSSDEMKTASRESDGQDKDSDRSADWKPGTFARKKGGARKRPKPGKKAGKSKGKKAALTKVSAGGAPASPATTGVNIGNAAPVPTAKSGKALKKAAPPPPDAALVIERMCIACNKREANGKYDTCCALCKDSGGKKHEKWCDHNQDQIDQYNGRVEAAWRAQVQKGPSLTMDSG